MNVLIPFSWLKDFVQTDAGIKDVAKTLSLHALSVERIIDDDVFEVEVTPNRGDALSVLGIAREMLAVLPGQGYKADWIKKTIPVKGYSGKDNLKVNITDHSLVPRFSAVVLDKVEIKDSPDLIKERLSKVGIRPINNVVDVTNYMMIELGQPMHAFDYDKIGGHEMNVRESKKGESIITLDGVKRLLPEGVIVIEDGNGRLIDLCGIMGAQNSEVDEKTKKVLLFVQVYDPVKIRRTSMSIGHRTEAALRFEKGIDFEGVIPSLRSAVEMLEETSGCKPSSELIDITSIDYKPKSIKMDYKKISQIAGFDLDPKFIDSTLLSLGFIINKGYVEVPSWRFDDIDIIEDLAEEVIRIYGYHKLPSILPNGAISQHKVASDFSIEDHAKDFLKYMGFFECYNYSFTTSQLSGEGAMKLKNPLNTDLEYLRTSLTPKLVDILNKNKGFADKLKVFELSAVFNDSIGDLPNQPQILALAVKDVGMLEFKGIIEALLIELKVDESFIFNIVDHGSNILTCEMNFDLLTESVNKVLFFKPLTGFNSIKEDMTFIIENFTPFNEIINEVSGVDPRIFKVTFKDMYEDALTISIEFLDRTSQLTSEDTKQIRGAIVSTLGKKFGIKLKG